MSDISLKNRTLATLESFAANTGNETVQAHAEELRGLANIPVTESPDKMLAAKLAQAWAGVYGADQTLWPEGLREAVENINLSVDLGSFENTLIASLQDLRIKEETVPAFAVGMAVVAPFMGPDSPINRATTTGLVPEGAARAGLYFISNPATIVIPMWSAGLFGRLAAGGVSAFGRFLGVATESAAALSIAASVPVEAAAFMGTSRVTQYVAQDFSPAGSIGGPEGLRYTVEEFAASTIFFSGLKAFSWVGALAQSVLPLTETGVAIAKLTGHATAITGLASMEEVQEGMGLYVAERFSVPQDEWNPKGFRYTDERPFSEKLWRAAFLHGTVQLVNGVVNLKGAGSNNDEIMARARGFLESLRTVTFADARPATEMGTVPINIFYLGGKDKGDGGKRAEPAMSKEEYQARAKSSQMQTNFATAMNALKKAMPQAYVEDIGQNLWFVFKLCEGDKRAQQDLIDILQPLSEFFRRNMKAGSKDSDRTMLAVALGSRQIYERIKHIPGIFRFSVAEGRFESKTFYNPMSVFLKEAAHVKNLNAGELATWLNYLSETIVKVVPILHQKGKNTAAINGTIRTFVEAIGDRRRLFIPALRLRELLKAKVGPLGNDLARLLLEWIFNANASRSETGRRAGYKVYTGFGEKTLAYLAKVYEMFCVWTDAAPKEAPASLAMALQHALYAFGAEQNPHKAAYYLDEAGHQDIFDAHRLEGMYQSQPWAKKIGFPEGVFLDRLAFVLINEPHRVKAVLDTTIGFNERAMASTIRKLFMENCIETSNGAQSLISMLRDGAIPEESREPIIDYVLHVMELYKSQLEGDPQSFVLTLEFWQEMVSAILVSGTLNEDEQVYFRSGLRANGFNIGGGEATVKPKDIWGHLAVLGFKREGGLPKRDAAKKAMSAMVHRYHQDHNPGATAAQKEANKEKYQTAVEAWQAVEGKLPK